MKLGPEVHLAASCEFFEKNFTFFTFFLRKIFLIWDLTLKNKVKFSVWRNIKLSQILQGCRLLKSHASCGLQKDIWWNKQTTPPQQSKAKAGQDSFFDMEPEPDPWKDPKNGYAPYAKYPQVIFMNEEILPAFYNCQHKRAKSQRGYLKKYTRKGGASGMTSANTKKHCKKLAMRLIQLRLEGS